MDNVKLVSSLEASHHVKQVKYSLIPLGIPEKVWADRLKSGLTDGVTTGKQGNFVAPLYQVLGEQTDYKFGAAITQRGHPYF